MFQLEKLLMGSIIQTFWDRNCDLLCVRNIPGLLKNGLILLHDNATPHKSWHVTSVIDEYKWETFKHPAYSLDLSPCDFNLFPELKKPLRWIRFEDLDELLSYRGQGGSKYLLWLPSNRNRRLTKPMERSHQMRGKLLRRILAMVGLYNLLFSCTKTIVRTFWLTSYIKLSASKILNVSTQWFVLYESSLKIFWTTLVFRLTLNNSR